MSGYSFKIFSRPTTSPAHNANRNRESGDERWNPARRFARRFIGWRKHDMASLCRCEAAANVHLALILTAPARLRPPRR